MIIYRLGIKETAKGLNIIAERVDEQIYREDILDRIYRQIDIADIIVADMSGKNPNVFYEVAVTALATPTSLKTWVLFLGEYSGRLARTSLLVSSNPVDT